MLDELIPDVLQFVHPPADASRAVTDATILDGRDTASIRAGVLVLAVGLCADDPQAVEIVRAAGRSKAAGIVFRAPREIPEGLLDAARGADVPVLTTPPEMAWGQLYSLVQTAIANDGGDAIGGVPVGDLFALADALAASFGGPVTIEDSHARVLAFANLDFAIDEARRQTILGRIPPAEWLERLERAGVSHILRTTDEVVRFEDPDESFAPRLAVAVRSGGAVLGTIWVAETGSPFGEETHQQLRNATASAAVHLIAHRVSDDVRRRTRAAVVGEMLAGRLPGGQFAADGPFTVLAFEAIERAAGADDRILSIVNLHCEDAHPEAMCACLDGRYWALLPTRGPKWRERTVALAGRIVERVESGLQVRLVAGIGGSVREGEVPASRRAAEQALKIAREAGREERVVHIEEVRAHAVLLELMELAAGHPSLLEGRLGTLLEHDRRHGSDYAATLAAYLDAFGDINAAARRVGVHPNTMRYRVRRLSAVSGIDLSDPDERFATEFQLRLARHGAPSSS